VKLLTKTTFYFITIMLFVIFAGGVGFYHITRTMTDKEVNQELVNQMHQFMLLEKGYKTMPEDSLFTLNRIEINEVAGKPSNQWVSYHDTVLFDDLQKIYLPYRNITFFIHKNNQLFRIRIYKSLLQSNEMVENITLSMTLLALFFIFGAYFLNRFVFSKIWSDFFGTLNKVKRFDPTAGKIKLSGSETIEFQELNQVLERMTDRISNDFINLKEFTMNTAHEIQTPLAVVKSKVELLLQTENLTDEQVSLIHSIYTSTIRLSKLTQTLTLLAKIENHQFNQLREVSFATITNQQLNLFEEHIQSRKLTIHKDFNTDFVMKMDETLADILVTNLIKNAIIHNIDNGNINIVSASNKLSISNTGPALTVSPEKLFNRFVQSANSSGSMGLGLAIVKKICDIYSLQVHYEYNGSLHIITVEQKD